MTFNTIKFALVLGTIATAFGFYLPGVAPRSFHRGDDVELKVNKLRLMQQYCTLFTSNFYLFFWFMFF